MKKIMIFSLLVLASLTSAAKSNESDFNRYSNESHEVKIINHGLAALEERIELIEEAVDTIDVEYYIFKHDLSSKIIIQALLKKVQQGVRVRLLIDHFANRGVKNPIILTRLQEMGFEIKYFNTTPMINLYHVQFRNHRKALIIDNKKAIVGGRNIGNEYFDLDPNMNFLDRDMTIEGSIVNSIANTFEENFNSKWAKPLKKLIKPDINQSQYRFTDNFQEGYAKFNQDIHDWNKEWNQSEDFIFNNVDTTEIRSIGREQLAKSPRGTCDKLTFLSERPSFGRKNKYERILKNVIKEKIQIAQENVVIESPYFILTDEFKDVLNSSLNNKTSIKLLTNSINSTDHVFVYSAFESELYQIIHSYLDTYIANGNRPENYPVPTSSSQSKYGIHSKTFVFDNKDFIISTFNFDPRSTNINSELLIMCEDSPELAMEIKNNINSRLKETTHIESSEDIAMATLKDGSIQNIIISLLSKIPARIFKGLL